MTTSLLGILFLFVVILMSVSQRVNVGLLSLGLAWVLGHFFAGMKTSQIISAFPVSMFVVLVAVSYFFGIASHNGTLEKIIHFLIRSVRGKIIFLPIVFFVLAVILSTLGAGNIATVALLAPVALAIASRSGLGAFFMTVMLIYGANAGTFSPVAFTGVIANQLTSDLGLTLNSWTQIYLPAFLIQTFIAAVNFFIFILFLRKKPDGLKTISLEEAKLEPFTTQQILTLIAIAVLMVGVSFFKFDVGFLAIVLGILLTVVGAVKNEEQIKSVPWGVVMMVCGVSTLVSMIEKTGGMDILVSVLAKISNPQTATGILAFTVGVISSFSSSSAVVMPTFIPMIPGLIEKLGSGDPVAFVCAVNVGAHIVDISPLSTLGALCLASAANSENKQKLFRWLLIYGLSMSFVGAIVSYIFW